jgi:hypothetical protein
MTQAVVSSMPHPLVRGVAELHAVLDSMPIGGWDGLESTVVRELAKELSRIVARVSAHQIGAARALEESGAAAAAGATSTGAMLADGFGGDRAAGDRMVRTGKALRAATATEEALSNGDISSTQAEVIAGALATLPDDTTEDDRRACEDTLIGDAPRYTMRDFRRRSRRLADAIAPAPEVDAHENTQLENREKAARARSEFWMSDNHDGTVRGGFTIPEHAAEMLRNAIEAISAPRRDHLHDADSMFDRDMDHRHRLGLGFAELCEHLPTDGLPAHGGVGATLLVRFDYDTLARGVAAATLSTGTRLSASATRKLACRLGIIPEVFDGESLPLDHGREKRLFTKAQRQAMETRDGGCVFPGCDRPPSWCETHHANQPFSHGGATNLNDGVLICPRHHHIVHTDGWEMRFHPHDGTPEVRSPGTVNWQRNNRWRP